MRDRATRGMVYPSSSARALRFDTGNARPVPTMQIKMVTAAKPHRNLADGAQKKEVKRRLASLTGEMKNRHSTENTSRRGAALVHIEALAIMNMASLLGALECRRAAARTTSARRKMYIGDFGYISMSALAS